MLPQKHQVVLTHQTDLVDHWHASCSCGWHAEDTNHDVAAGEGQNHATRWGSKLKVEDPLATGPDTTSMTAPAPTAVEVPVSETINTSLEKEVAPVTMERERQDELAAARKSLQPPVEVPVEERPADAVHPIGETVQERLAKRLAHFQQEYRVPATEQPKIEQVSPHLEENQISDKIEHATGPQHIIDVDPEAVTQE